jgi:hypothetical protein
MTKEMEYGEYLKIFEQAQLKGWKIQAFQIGFDKKNKTK